MPVYEYTHTYLRLLTYSYVPTHTYLFKRTYSYVPAHTYILIFTYPYLPTHTYLRLISAAVRKRAKRGERHHREPDRHRLRLPLDRTAVDLLQGTQYNLVSVHLLQGS